MAESKTGDADATGRDSGLALSLLCHDANRSATFGHLDALVFLETIELERDRGEPLGTEEEVDAVNELGMLKIGNGCLKDRLGKAEFHHEGADHGFTSRIRSFIRQGYDASGGPNTPLSAKPRKTGFKIVFGDEPLVERGVGYRKGMAKGICPRAVDDGLQDIGCLDTAFFDKGVVARAMVLVVGRVLSASRIIGEEVDGPDEVVGSVESEDEGGGCMGENPCWMQQGVGPNNQ